MKTITIDGKEQVALKGDKPGRVHYLTPERYARQLELCRELLENHSGYLYAGDREKITAFLNDDVALSPNDLPEQATLRAQRFMNAGIQPIFEQGLENETDAGKRFPVLDDIILQGSGNLSQKVAAKATARDVYTPDWRRNERNMLIPRAKPEDVLAFAQRAYDNGQVNPQFVRDLGFRVRHYTKASDKNKARYEAAQNIALSYLQNALKVFIPEQSSYSKKYEQGMDLKFVYGKSMWHLDYSPEDRQKIANDFADRIKKKELPRSKLTVMRMKTLFPEIDLPGVEDLIASEIRGRTQNALKEGNAMDVSSAILCDPQFRDLYVQWLGKMDNFFKEKYEQDPQLFTRSVNNDFAKSVGIRSQFMHIPDVREILNRYRLQALENLSDEDFLAQFSQQRTGKFGIGNLSIDDAQTIHHYVLERRKRILG